MNTPGSFYSFLAYILRLYNPGCINSDANTYIELSSSRAQFFLIQKKQGLLFLRSILETNKTDLSQCLNLHTKILSTTGAELCISILNSDLFIWELKI